MSLKETMSKSFNRILSSDPVCISIKNVDDDKYDRDFIKEYLKKIILNDTTEITDIHIAKDRTVYVCFDHWLVREEKGETHTNEMEQMTDSFAHGYEYLVPAPGTVDLDFIQDWVFEYVDSVRTYSEPESDSVTDRPIIEWTCTGDGAEKYCFEHKNMNDWDR